jgi:transcriptional regulator with XRE-family HTH domain
MSHKVNKADTKLWLHEAMEKLELTSLDELAKISGIDAGSISRYFNLERRPSIDVIEPLAIALKVKPGVIMRVLGATTDKYDCC